MEKESGTEEVQSELPEQTTDEIIAEIASSLRIERTDIAKVNVKKIVEKIEHKRK